jgi:hypothetical protein
MAPPTIACGERRSNLPALDLPPRKRRAALCFFLFLSPGAGKGQQAIGRRKRQQCHSGGSSVKNILWTLHWNFRFDGPDKKQIFY